MYISKLELNDRQSIVRQDLSNIHKLHQRIMHGFPDERREKARADWQVLFRLEPDSNVVLVQSDIAPDWSKLPPEYLYRQHHKPFEPEASQFPIERSLWFRLKANPSKRAKDTGKTVGIYYQPEQVAWFERQAERNGFEIEALDVLPTANLWGAKERGKSPIKIHTALFQGVLKVRDPALFVTAIRAGIGRGKSYGCGLLSLQRIALDR